ncbi:MAG TPA: hypothetical protein VK612_06635 [Pyrinomonadaceae bacterium]|nr:hypothetical protein [Pyrinomonadaceae bacterium]
MNFEFRVSSFGFLCIFTFAFLLGSCSIPNLEPPSCIESRTDVREFYSFHFGNGLAFSQESLKQRERFLTPELAKRLEVEKDGADPFTTRDTDFPKAFRVGECKEISPERTEFQVLLFWRDDTRTEQREIRVEVVKDNDKWLIDKISSEFQL